MCSLIWPVTQLPLGLHAHPFDKRTVCLAKVDRVSTKVVVEEPESELMAKLKKRCGAYRRAWMWTHIHVASYFNIIQTFCFYFCFVFIFSSPCVAPSHRVAVLFECRLRRVVA